MLSAQVVKLARLRELQLDDALLEAILLHVVQLLQDLQLGAVALM